MQCFEYLKEEWTLAFSLRAGGPEPVRKSISLCSGDIVTQSQWLLLQLFWWTVPGQQAFSLALYTQDKARNELKTFLVKWIDARSQSIPLIYPSIYILQFWAFVLALLSCLPLTRLWKHFCSTANKPVVLTNWLQNGNTATVQNLGKELLASNAE